MPVFAVRHDYVAGSEALRGIWRDQHLEFLETLYQSGTLPLCGRLDRAGDAVGALLVVTCDSAAEVARVLSDDPYTLNGIVCRQEIVTWNIVLGAATLA